MRATATWGLLALVLTGCQCVLAPDIRYACANDDDCTAAERCVSRHCAVADAGLGSDAGSIDAGSPDAGVDAGEPDAGPLDAGSDAGADGGCPATEANCADGVDEDCDTFTDCEDDDCRNQVCRTSTAPCDIAERCVSSSCPLDGWKAINDVCEDQQPCTTDSRCLVDAGCAGVPGEVVFQCFAFPSLRNLVVGTCPTNTCAFDGGAVLFREVPDAVAPGFPVFSVALDAGMDAGGVCLYDACIDWRLATSPQAGYCPSNSFTGKVSLTTAVGLIPVYQYRSAAGLGSFGLSATPPAGDTLEPSGPLFWACPP